MQKQDALGQGTRPFRQHQHAGPSARADVALSAAGARGKAGASSTCRGRGNAIRFRASAPREAHYAQSAEAAAGPQVEWTAARGRAKLTSLAAVRACGHPAPQRPAISASSTRMSAAGGRTIGLRIRIGSARCSASRAPAPRRNSSQPTPLCTTLSTSNAISRQLNHTVCSAPRPRAHGARSLRPHENRYPLCPLALRVTT